jgi:hypothetical protein
MCLELQGQKFAKWKSGKFPRLYQVSHLFGLVHFTLISSTPTHTAHISISHSMGKDGTQKSTWKDLLVTGARIFFEHATRPHSSVTSDNTRKAQILGMKAFSL